jgi:hypothetical protein
MSPFIFKNSLVYWLFFFYCWKNRTSVFLVKKPIFQFILTQNKHKYFDKLIYDLNKLENSSKNWNKPEPKNILSLSPLIKKTENKVYILLYQN